MIPHESVVSEPIVSHLKGFDLFCRKRIIAPLEQGWGEGPWGWGWILIRQFNRPFSIAWPVEIKGYFC